MCLASVDFSNLVCAFLSTIKRVQKLHKIRLGINSFIIRNMSESQAARLFPLVMLLDDADYFTITPGNCRIHSTTIRIDKNIKKAFCYCFIHAMKLCRFQQADVLVVAAPQQCKAANAQLCRTVPVTVRQSPCRKPFCSKYFNTAGTPPTCMALHRH